MRIGDRRPPSRGGNGVRDAERSARLRSFCRAVCPRIAAEYSGLGSCRSYGDPLAVELIVTGIVADVPSLRLATIAAVTLLCPELSAPAGKGKVTNHLPGPVWPRLMLCEPI